MNIIIKLADKIKHRFNTKQKTLQYSNTENNFKFLKGDRVKFVLEFDDIKLK